ncbi:MAG: Trm112 family protein [Burkholderiaceae bacterium]|nr:Trm112 family protein [Burkholderiaceae bacterium]
MDNRLLEILVCPNCKGKLRVRRGPITELDPPAEAELICDHDGIAFPVRDDIPVMLLDEARRLEPDSGETEDD